MPPYHHAAGSVGITTLTMVACSAADMDGFKLLEHIGLELDLPVISAHHVVRFPFLSLTCSSLSQYAEAVWCLLLPERGQSSRRIRRR